MNATITRKISRRVDISETVVPLPQMYSPRLFRPTLLAETATRETAADGSEQVRHVVEVSGPALTSTGKDHASNRGKSTFYGAGGWRSAQTLDDLPEPLRKYVFGPKLMLAELGWLI